MPKWVRVASPSDCPAGTGMEVVADGQVIALFNVDGTFHAVDGICAHQGGPLSRGQLNDTTVTCPWHGWQYDVCSGRHLLSRITQRLFPVKVSENDVLVDVEDRD